MKPNPCKRCGKEPFFWRETFTRRVLCCGSRVESSVENDAILGWNAMNPLPQSDKCGPMPVDEAEFAKGIAKQADAIEQLRASDCPTDVRPSRTPIADALVNSGKAHYMALKQLADLERAANAMEEILQLVVEHGDCPLIAAKEALAQYRKLKP